MLEKHRGKILVCYHCGWDQFLVLACGSAQGRLMTLAFDLNHCPGRHETTLCTAILFPVQYPKEANRWPLNQIQKLFSCALNVVNMTNIIFQARESSEEDWDSDESPKKKRKKEKKKKKQSSIKVGRRRRHSSDEDGPSTSRPSRAARTKKASYGRLRKKQISCFWHSSKYKCSVPHSKWCHFNHDPLNVFSVAIKMASLVISVTIQTMLE